MIKVENIETWGFEHAIRGMRNPLNSWEKSDSKFNCDGNCSNCPDEENGKCIAIYGTIGQVDLDLMRRLYKAGTEHRKYARQIFVSMDITAPLYWWKEFDTYKVGTVSNSCSTMHKIQDKEFTLDDFSCEHLFGYNNKTHDIDEPLGVMNIVIDTLNDWRKSFLQDKDKDEWWQMIQLLPESYNQRRTVTFTYENVFSMIKQRTGHKLDEWNDFVETLKYLPYVKEIIGE